MPSTVFVTTSIPYVNARPHVGFALELVQADALARYHRQQGREVRFQTGTDENALKNVLAARAVGVDPQALVNANAGRFRALAEALDISCDDFLRTTEPRHHRGVAWLWGRPKPSDLYRQSYQGRYCVGCEDFLRDTELVEGRCADHHTEPSRVEEQNVFFRLSAYQAELERLIATDTLRILPAQRKAEVLAFLRRGLRDISVTRSAEQYQGWGIPVPGDSGQVIYVWIDALVNYLSALGFGGPPADAERFWGEAVLKTHVIGKNVWKFHALYWPALLLSAGLPLPNELLVHGFLTENGKKISKSGPPSIDPLEVAHRLGVDGLRYALLAGAPPGSDADFSLESASARYTADLCHGLGNLVSRVLGLCQKAGLTHVEPGAVAELPKGYTEALEAFRFDEALAGVFAQVHALNLDITRTRPWKLLPAQSAQLREVVLPGWIHALRAVGEQLAPFLPATQRRLARALHADPLLPGEALFPKLLPD